MGPRGAPNEVIAGKDAEPAHPGVPVSASLSEIWVVDFWCVGIGPENRRCLEVIEPVQERKCLLDFPVAPRGARRSVIANRDELEVARTESHGLNPLWQWQGEQLG